MGENEITNDTVENDISTETVDETFGNAQPENTADVRVDAEADVAVAVAVPEDSAEDEGAPVSSDAQDTDEDNVEEGVAPVEVAADTTDGNPPHESKDHKADLAGYRAYRKKNIRQDDVAEKIDKKQSAKMFADFKSGSISLYTIVLAALTILDLFAMHLFTSKQAYNVSDKILSALGFDALHFTDITYEQICLGLGYFVAFIFGGVIVLILMKLLGKLFSHFTDWKIGGYCPIIALGIFAVVFVIGFVVVYFSKDAVLISNVFRWGAPAAAYVGGLLFYGASKLHVGIEY